MSSMLGYSASKTVLERHRLLFEMRIDYGPGYSVNFARHGAVLYLLLIGGDKGSQKRDIKRAIAMARTLPKE
jgi:putative addiction module killer protein